MIKMGMKRSKIKNIIDIEHFDRSKSHLTTIILLCFCYALILIEIVFAEIHLYI